MELLADMAESGCHILLWLPLIVMALALETQALWQPCNIIFTLTNQQKNKNKHLLHYIRL